LVNIDGKSRVWITIIEDVAAGTNIARIILLMATKRKYPKSIWRSKIWRTILKGANFIKTFTRRLGFTPLRTPARPAGERGTNLWVGGVEAAKSRRRRLRSFLIPWFVFGYIPFLLFATWLRSRYYNILHCSFYRFMKKMLQSMLHTLKICWNTIFATKIRTSSSMWNEGW
jgi:hypothetical protein